MISLQQCRFHHGRDHSANMNNVVCTMKNYHDKINTTEKVANLTNERLNYETYEHFDTQGSILYHLIKLIWSHVAYIENFIFSVSQTTVLEQNTFNKHYL